MSSLLTQLPFLSVAREVVLSHPVESLLFFVLVLITVYRKRLSSNHSYRDKQLLSEEDRRRERILQLRKKRSGSSSSSSFMPLPLSLSVPSLNAFNPLAESLSSAYATPLGNTPLPSEPSTPKYPSSLSPSTLPSIASLTLLVLSQELLLLILSHLETKDIARLARLSPSFLREIRADFIWEQLWAMTYGSLWSRAGLRSIRLKRQIAWDPLLRYPRPQYGWYRFYLAFEISWTDWVLAGLCTRECCCLAINDAIFDVTDFVPQHPGSSETLLDHSGCDATEEFEEIGHSSQALSLMGAFCLLDPHHLYTSADPSSPSSSSPAQRQVSSYLTPLHLSFRAIQKTLLAQLAQRQTASARATAAVGLRDAGDPFPLGDPFPVAPELKGYLPCKGGEGEGVAHEGQARVFFDPLSREWIVWHTCCGQGRCLLSFPKEILQESLVRTIFE